MDLNSCDENNVKNGDKNIEFKIGFLEVITMFCQCFGWIYALKKEILTPKFVIDIFFDKDLIDLIRKPKHNNRFPIHIMNRDPALVISTRGRSV